MSDEFRAREEASYLLTSRGNPTRVRSPLRPRLDEMVRALICRTSIDAPTVEVVSPNHLNIHYPADGSLASIRIEARAGAWGGLGPKGTPEHDAERNAHYDAMAAAAAPPPPEGGVTAREEEQPAWRG